MKEIININIENEVISLIKDISFTCVPSWYGSTMRNLKMNILAPKVRQGHAPCPTIVWICGGAFRVVDNAVWLPEMIYFAKKGYVVASVEYRTSNETTFPDPLIDVKSAIRYLKAHATDFCVDPEKIFVMGESAGGTIASLVGVTQDIKEFDIGDYLEYDSKVRAVVDFYGMSDFTEDVIIEGNKIVPPWAIQDFLGIDYTDDMARKASALTYINENTPPFMILHGSNDNLVPISQSDKLYEKLQEKGVYVHYYVLEGAGHGEDHFYQEKILNLIDGFFQKFI